MATALAATGLAVAFFHATSVVVEESAATQTLPIEKYQGAMAARRLAPWRADSLSSVALAALETGDRERVQEAAEELRDYRWLRPRSAALADLRGRLERSRGHGPSAAEEAWNASRAHPNYPIYQDSMEELFSRLRGKDGG